MVKHIKMFALTGLTMTGLAVGGAMAQTERVDQVINVEQQTAQAEQQSQQQVDQISDQTQDIVEDYRSVARQIDDTRIYNAQLSKQVADQQREIRELDQAIEDVSTIRRQITPLMLEMVDTLEKFVEADMPFNKTQRLDRIEELRSFLDRGDISVAEQFRQILETYQTENEYGRTVSNYTGTVNHNGEDRQVEFLRIGRIFLGYRAEQENTNVVGFWNKNTGAWDTLPASDGRIIDQGLRFAKKQANPELLMLPLPAPETY